MTRTDEIKKRVNTLLEIGGYNYAAWSNEDIHYLLCELQKKTRALDIAKDVLEEAQKYLVRGPFYDYGDGVKKALAKIAEIEK